MTQRPGLVIVAAGLSTRMAGVDKVWAPLRGEPLLWHSLRRLAPRAGHTVVVVRPDMLDRARAELLPAFPDLILVRGGAERRDSVLNGLTALPTCEIVAVHDAARPLASPRLLDVGIAHLDGAEGSIPVLPVNDTVKRVDNERIVSTVDRSTLRLAQTPQLFRTACLISAHERTPCMSHTDDAAVMEAIGAPVAVFPGEPWNVKITTAEDLALADALLERQCVP